MSLALILRWLLTSLVASVVSGQAHAQVPTGQAPWDPLSLARVTIYFEVSLDSCTALRSQPTFESRRSALDRALPFILDGLTARAQLVHPARSPDELRADIEQWFDLHRNVTTQSLSEADICTIMPDHVWSALSGDFESDAFPEKMQAMANAPFTYGRQIPLVDGSNELSYALPVFQERILESIASNTGCDAQVVDGVYFVKDSQNTANNLPAFIGPPVTYAEVWVTRCRGQEHKSSVFFTRDSESMLKEPIVEPISE